MKNDKRRCSKRNREMLEFADLYGDVLSYEDIGQRFPSQTGKALTKQAVGEILRKERRMREVEQELIELFAGIGGFRYGQESKDK